MPNVEHTTISDSLLICHDCGVPEGQLHAFFPNCDQEICPICLEQLLSCPHHTQPKTVERRKRIPFVYFPILCVRCGQQDPEFFSVPTREWQRIVPKSHWGTVVCWPCYTVLKQLAAEEKGA